MSNDATSPLRTEEETSQYPAPASSNISGGGNYDKHVTGNTTTTSSSLSPSTLSYVIAAIVLGSSAGMTLYTRKAGSMLGRMNELTKAATKLEVRRHPPTFGPPTKTEFEKLRNDRQSPNFREEDDNDDEERRRI